jgi:hypothetical protein
MKTLITVLGWEERFLEGMKITFEKYSLNQLILITFKDYVTMEGMEGHLDIVNEWAKEKNIDLRHIELQYSDSINNWRNLDHYFTINNDFGEVILNITTIPRETIWTLLFFLRKTSDHINYIYFKPIDYTKEWLTRNHKDPRLLFKHSGIFELQKPLVLFVVTGFDAPRLDQLVEYYEPNKVVVFCQKGEQFKNLERNNTISESNQTLVQKVEIDSYSVDEASSIIKEQIGSNLDHNIILAAQGPKLSSLSAYRCYLDYPDQVALAYVPAREFHTQYSVGVNEEFVSDDFVF